MRLLLGHPPGRRETNRPPAGGARRTRFIKTYGNNDNDVKVWEAILESSSAPTIFPVYTPGSGGYYTDGGAGAYGNPAYVAAREAIEGCVSVLEDRQIAMLRSPLALTSPAKQRGETS